MSISRTYEQLAKIAVVLAILATGRAHAAGFAINEWNARALGMGNAVVGMAHGPSAIVSNPAGIGKLEGLSFEAGVTLVNPSFGYTVPVPGTSTEIDVSGDNQLFPVPAAYLTYRLHDRVAVGLGFYSMYGLGVKWAPTVDVPGEGARAWWARHLIEEISLQTAYITPSVSVKLHDRLYLGGGFAIVKAAVLMQRAVTLTNSLDDDVMVEIGAGDLGFTGNAGLLFEAVPNLLNIGVTYRGGVALQFEGDAAFSRRDGSAPPESLRGALLDSAARAAIEMPHVLSFGLAAFPIESLTIGIGVDVTTWSSYEELRVDFIDDEGKVNEELSSGEAKNWESTLTIRLGAEYRLLDNKLPVRLGFFYDQSPVPDTTVAPELPDADRYGVTLGVGYKHGEFTADLAYLFLMTGDNESAATAPLVGTYRAHAHLLGLTLGYRLDL